MTPGDIAPEIGVSLMGGALSLQEDSSLAERQAIVLELISKYGQDLVNALVTDLACLPVYMSEEVTVVLYEMLQCFPKVRTLGVGLLHCLL